MNARDELFQLILGRTTTKAVERILAAGYRKQRTITTEEELDALPVGSVIKDRDRDVCQRFRTGWRATIHEEHDDPWLTDTLEVDLPATVLYEPEPTP